MRCRTMPESQPKGLDKDPQCVKCGSKMRFSCTEPEPEKPGFVHHIYECTKWINSLCDAPPLNYRL
jgi:hypothetical protein